MIIPQAHDFSWKSKMKTNSICTCTHPYIRTNTHTVTHKLNQHLYQWHENHTLWLCNALKISPCENQISFVCFHLIQEKFFQQHVASFCLKSITLVWPTLSAWGLKTNPPFMFCLSCSCCTFCRSNSEHRPERGSIPCKTHGSPARPEPRSSCRQWRNRFSCWGHAPAAWPKSSDGLRDSSRRWWLG